VHSSLRRRLTAAVVSAVELISVALRQVSGWWVVQRVEGRGGGGGGTEVVPRKEVGLLHSGLACKNCILRGLFYCPSICH